MQENKELKIGIPFWGIGPQPPKMQENEEGKKNTRYRGNRVERRSRRRGRTTR